jgi:hypothetical protein
MGKLIAIDKLYMNKIPNSCKECPLTYLDAYFGANERRCVIDDSCIDGIVSERAYDCPLVEAIPKADYENRLKADMLAMLTEIQLEIEELDFFEGEEPLNITQELIDEVKSWEYGVKDCKKLIQQKINALKSESEEYVNFADDLLPIIDEVESEGNNGNDDGY